MSLIWMGSIKENPRQGKRKSLQLVSTSTGGIAGKASYLGIERLLCLRFPLGRRRAGGGHQLQQLPFNLLPRRCKVDGLDPDDLVLEPDAF